MNTINAKIANTMAGITRETALTKIQEEILQTIENTARCGDYTCRFFITKPRIKYTKELASFLTNLGFKCEASPADYDGSFDFIISWKEVND